MFRSLDMSLYEKPQLQFAPGPAPSLHWLTIESLVVDQAYQREIGKKGRANVKLIAERFEWSKFAPVIVASIEGGKYAIVDGQHRTTAAALRGIETVPCQLIIADQSQQAQAYAAVNGAITKTTPQQLFHAKVTARDATTVEIHEICQIAGVFVTHRNRIAANYEVGETQAIGAITRCLRKYGKATLITALQCVTQTSHGNPGCLRSTVIEALCAVLNRRHDWRDAGSALLRAMDEYNFLEEWDRVTEGKNVILSRVVVVELVNAITQHLEQRLKTALKATFVDKAPKQTSTKRLRSAA